MESDDDDSFCQDVGASYAVVAGNAKSASALYSLSGASITPSILSHSTYFGSSSHVATSCLSCASGVASSSIVIADSGTTDHMWHDYSAFTSYHPTSSKHVLLADNTKAPVAGIGSIKILLDGHVCGVRNVLHVPSLRVPLYSLCAHRRMNGCGFINDNGRFQVYFPRFVTTIDDSVDAFIPYSPLGHASSLLYDFRQSRTPSTSGASSSPPPPVQNPPAIIPFTTSELDDPPSDSDSDDSYNRDFPPLPTDTSQPKGNTSSPVSTAIPSSTTNKASPSMP